MKLVLMHVTLEFPNGPPNKLVTQRAGPYQVMKRVDDSHYVVKELGHHKLYTVHISRLESFIFDMSRIDPLRIALKDKGEDIVESVLKKIRQRNVLF